MPVSRQDARAVLWRQGVLVWKLKRHQRDLYYAFTKSIFRKFAFLCSRRLGKSFTLLIIALEYALRNPNAKIKYVAATQRNVKEIIQPLMAQILEDCPDDIRPKWRSQDSKYVFANGSTITVAGTDNGNADRLRGPSCDLALIEEAAFMSDLTYVIKSILMPQLLTTNGRMLFATTPPESPGHEFTHIYGALEAEGATLKRTIYDDSRQEVLDRIPEWMAESGGEESTHWQREYLCRFVTDQTRAVIPEFNDTVAQFLVREHTRPLFYDSYVGMDVGFTDFTAVLFSYWDFLNATLVIEDELDINKMTTEDLAIGIRAKEAANWGDKPPFLRVSDVEPIVVNDLGKLHKLYFAETAKDDKEAAVNGLRLLVKQGKILINPRCKGLIAHLKYGIWNKARTKFERVEGFGHFDYIDALVYLVRNIRRDRNPWPATHGMSHASHFIPKDLQTGSADARALAQALNPMRRRN